MYLMSLGLIWVVACGEPEGYLTVCDPDSDTCLGDLDCVEKVTINEMDPTPGFVCSKRA